MMSVGLSRPNWDEDVDLVRDSGATALRMGDSHPGLGVFVALALLDSFFTGLGTL
jgi:hypothetical protein